MLKVKNVNDNGPDLDSVIGEGSTVTAPNDAGQFEISVTEAVDSNRQVTLTLQGSDADNPANDNLRNVTSNTREASETVIHYDNGKILAILNNVDTDLTVNDFTGSTVTGISEEDLPLLPDIS